LEKVKVDREKQRNFKGYKRIKLCHPAPEKLGI
jgi:hypothetical protein